MAHPPTQADQAGAIRTFSDGLDQIAAQLKSSDPDVRRLIGTGRDASDTVGKLVAESGVGTVGHGDLERAGAILDRHVRAQVQIDVRLVLRQRRLGEAAAEFHAAPVPVADFVQYWAASRVALAIEPDLLTARIEGLDELAAAIARRTRTC